MTSRIVVNTIVLNEQENIVHYLNNLRRVRDLWAVEILDGSWSDGPNINSTDRTEEIVEAWKQINFVPFETYYAVSEEKWRTESEKRNELLKRTEDKYGECWVFVLDADESVKFPNGRVGISLSKILSEYHNGGVIKAYGYNSTNALPTLRFIPTKKGIHYHTELAMILHDNECNVLIDYNPTRFYQSRDTWNLNDMIIVNYWGLRSGERQFTKYKYFHQQKYQDNETKCKWVKQVV
jgi:hypothetical protein